MYGAFCNRAPVGRILAGGVTVGAYPAADVTNWPWWLVAVASGLTIIGVTVGSIIRRRRSHGF